MDKLLHSVGDLPPHERSAVEAILGHSLRDDQQLYIVAFNTTDEPPVAMRRKAWSELEEIIAEARQAVCDAVVSPEELEATIDEACDQVRYGK